jgi:hypothetical protein
MPPAGSLRMPGGATTFGPPVNAAIVQATMPRQRSRIVVVTVTVTAPTDTTPPVTLFVSETQTRVSAVTGFTTTDVTWSADEDCQAWQIRDVTGAPGQTEADGVLVASGGPIAANAQQVTTISSASLSAGEGAKTLKLFAQDLAGNWTT